VLSSSLGEVGASYALVEWSAVVLLSGADGRCGVREVSQLWLGSPWPSVPSVPQMHAPPLHLLLLAAEAKYVAAHGAIVIVPQPSSPSLPPPAQLLALSPSGLLWLPSSVGLGLCVLLPPLPGQRQTT
jgi:hypothetical protein